MSFNGRSARAESARVRAKPTSANAKVPVLVHDMEVEYVQVQFADIAYSAYSAAI